MDATLDKALNLFWTKGYEATSMNDLVEAMGIQRASLYHAFGSKAELYAEALLAYQEQGFARLLALAETEGTALDKFRRLLESAIPCESNSGCFCVNAATEVAPHEPKIADQLKVHFDRVVQLLARIAASGQSEGIISTKWSPQDIGHTILSILHGLHVTAKTHPSERVLRAQIDLALHALRP